ncbi:hypothetical protein HFO77_36535 [Rhizobium leguminosarum]|uniref:hypothetical protein n=1 Tax=Rhizobium leguminosarum TaxID=384 RepID=UPI001C94D48F|nr:hypothetical protein [Rhizobium leguminosarum]MBY5919857.1 hypothetical protein [Rhizobium leguminosarum]
MDEQRFREAASVAPLALDKATSTDATQADYACGRGCDTGQALINANFDVDIGILRQKQRGLPAERTTEAWWYPQ